MTLSTTPIADVTKHYSPEDATVEAVLADLGKEDSPLNIAELAGSDQFHSGGLEATRLLIQRAGIKASDRVLDVGGAFGGPARLLAHDVGCHVTVVDLSEAYCRVGEKLTARTGLADRVTFRQGNALDLPFDAGSFDVVWTQHSSMNIADKSALYAQFHRVLSVVGRLALHEVTAGSGEPLHFPVPFARTEATSFLMEPEMFRETLTNAGFRELEWIDLSDWTNAWFQERQSAPQNGATVSNTLGLIRLLGPEAGLMARNFAINTQQGRVRVVQGVFERL